jgi:hypothetical protein
MIGELDASHAVNVVGRSRVLSVQLRSLGLYAEREDRKLVHTFYIQIQTVADIIDGLYVLGMTSFIL